jgi:hypothetical protein
MRSRRLTSGKSGTMRHQARWQVFEEKREAVTAIEAMVLPLMA